jgi:hypothetical protein
MERLGLFFLSQIPNKEGLSRGSSTTLSPQLKRSWTSDSDSNQDPGISDIQERSRQALLRKRRNKKNQYLLELATANDGLRRQALKLSVCAERANRTLEQELRFFQGGSETGASNQP